MVTLVTKRLLLEDLDQFCALDESNVAIRRFVWTGLDLLNESRDRSLLLK